MEDYYFEGKVVWQSKTFNRRDLYGQVWYGEKYVLKSLDGSQVVAFTVWDDDARALLRQNAEKGVFSVTLHFNVFEYKGNYHTNITCTSATLKKGRK